MIDVSAAEYQRFRLWAGIASITLNLGLGWGLYLAAPRIESLLGFLPFALQMVIVIEVALLMMLPFEVLTGHAAEAWSGRSLQPLSSWMLDWLHTAFRALLMAWVGGFWLGHSHFMDWPLRLMWGWLFFLLILVFALTLQFWAPRRGYVGRDPDAAYTEELQRELRSFGLQDVQIKWIREADTTSVNLTPLGFHAMKFALSTSFIDHFSPREAALLVWREASYQTTNRRTLSLGISMAWLIVGQFLAWVIPAASLLEAALGGMAVFSSWSLVSLFVLPVFSRSWVLDADSRLMDHASLDEAVDILRRLQELNSTDLNLGAGKTSVFHPIPPLNDRLRALRRAAGRGHTTPHANVLHDEISNRREGGE